MPQPTHRLSLHTGSAYTQAQPIKDGTYMAVPKGFEVEGDQSPEDYELKVNTNLYGSCDAGRAWYQHLVDRLHQEQP